MWCGVVWCGVVLRGVVWCCVLQRVLFLNLLQDGKARTGPTTEPTQHTSVPLLGGPTSRCVSAVQHMQKSRVKLRTLLVLAVVCMQYW